MADTTADAGQAPTPASTTAQAAVPTTSTDSQALKSPEDYEKMIADLRRENASHRTKLKAVEDAQAAAELAKLGDLEKATKQAEQLQKQVQQLRDENVKAQIRLQAKTLGIASDELIAPYVLAKLEYDDEGKPTNLDKVLDEIIKSNPNLVVQADSAAQTANTNRPPTTPANNPGRSTIVQPGQLPPNTAVRFHDLTWKK
jgi:hypothetical protein